MKRQIEDSGVETRVWSYGCVPGRVAEVKGEARGISQMKLGQRLWNVLVAIERAREERYKKVMADAVSARIAELKGYIDAARDEIKARRKKERKRTVDLGDLKEKIAEWRLERNALITIQKESSEQRHKERKVELDKLADVTRARIKKARQAAASMGLFWGTYNDIIQRADAGRKLGKLQFRGFRGKGTVTAQVMGGMSTEAAVGKGNGTFGIGGQVVGSAPRDYRYARIRVGSDEHRGPLWVEVPIVYHRDLPKDGVIKSVSVTRKVLANHPRWQLNVTCTVPKKPLKESGPVLAVDIGWRVVKNGVRVAYWVDERGRQGQVVVSIGDVGQFRKCESLGSICDKTRDEFLPKFAKWVNEMLARQLGSRDEVMKTEEMPARGPDARDMTEMIDWQKQTAFIGQWRSNDRLAGLIRWWGDHRLEGDEGWWFAAQEWRKRYLHLSNWQRNLQDQMTLRLREQYRVWSAWVAREYATVVIEEFDLREVAEKPQPEGERHQKGPASYRQIVSPSTLRGALKNACGREGVKVVALPAEWTTATCWKCDKKNEWDQGEELWHKCQHCPASWDQDENAARNLLKEWRRQVEKVEAVAV